MVNFQKYGERIEELLRLNGRPLAIKMLKNEKEIPENTKRPKKDFGTCMSTCIAFALSRWNGMSITQLFEDMWCPEPVIGLGFAETPEYFLEGRNRYPGSGVETLKYGSNWAREFPRFEAGKYIGIVSAPLRTANFEPDLLVIWCNTANLQRLLIGLAYRVLKGRDITTRLGAHAACVYAIVPAMKKGECQIAVPCSGDQRHTPTSENEMILSVPSEKIGDLVFGLEETHSSSPRTQSFEPEHSLSSRYVEMCKLMGMKKSDGTEFGYSETREYERKTKRNSV